MKQPPTSMQHLTIKRIPIKNADTVRYRVYTSPGEFVAVIAENALMAMKLTGIDEPYKVLRDLITEEGGVPESALDKEQTQMLNIATTAKQKNDQKPNLQHFTNPSDQSFKPISMSDLRKEEGLLEGVLTSPKLLRVLDEQAAAQAPKEAPVASEPTPEAEHVEVSPLDMAQQSLVEKAIPAEPLSAKAVVDLLSGKSD